MSITLTPIVREIPIKMEAGIDLVIGGRAHHCGHCGTIRSKDMHHDWYKVSGAWQEGWYCDDSIACENRFLEASGAK